MSDDDLAKQVGGVMRAQDEVTDPRLSRLALRALSDQEQANLQAEAKDDPGLADAMDVYEPLSPRVLKKLSATATLASRPRRRRWAAITTGGIALAAAAAATFAFLQIEQRAALPEYRLSVTGGDTQWRDDAMPVELSLRQDSELAIIVRPDRQPGEPVTARLWVIDGTSVHRSTATAEISDKGAARWLATAEALAGPATGDVVLWAVIGVPSAVASFQPSADETNVNMRGPGWRAFAVQVHIRPRGGGP